MAHKLFRLVNEKINNKPLLMTEESLRSVVEYLETRDVSMTAKEVEAAIANDSSERMEKVLTDNLAIIPIAGSLTYEETWMGALCGMTSYQGLLRDVEHALSTGIKTIVFDTSSGGGEAYAMMTTATSIRQRADKAGARIITYVDGMAASAAYGLAAISDEIIAHPDSQTGSIGVVIRLMNNSEKMKKEGYKQTYITSADSKVPFDTEGEFKSDFIEDLQTQVNELHTQFVAHVASYRPMSEEDINGLQAKVFNSSKALELGLIDSVMNHDQFAEYLETLEDGQPKSKDMGILNIFNKPSAAKADITNLEEDEAMKLAELQAQYDELSAKLESTVGQVSQLESDLMEALADVDEKDAELKAALAKVEEMENAKAQELADAKLAKLSAVVGDEEAKELFNDLSALPDAAFDKIVAGYAKANAALADNPMFKEVGVTVEADADLPKTQEDILAAKIAAQKSKNK